MEPHQYGAGSSRPASNPDGQQLGADDIQIERLHPTGFSLTDPITRAWELIKERPGDTLGYTFGVFALQFAVHMVFSIVMQMVMMVVMLGGQAIMEANETLGAVIMFTGLGIFYIAFLTVALGLGAVVQGAINIVWLRILRGQELSFEHLKEVRRFIKPLILSMFVVMIGYMGGLMLLFVPGVIFLLGVIFWQQIIVDKNLGPIQGVKAAWKLTQGHKINIFLFMILGSMINFLGMIPCGMGVLVTMPLLMGAMVAYYDYLAEPGNAYLQSGEGIEDVFV